MNENFAKLSRAQLLHGCVVSSFNLFHGKYGKHTYTSDDQLLEIAKSVKYKLNIPQPFFKLRDMQFGVNLLRFPNENSRRWQSFQLGDLEQM